MQAAMKKKHMINHFRGYQNKWRLNIRGRVSSCNQIKENHFIFISNGWHIDLKRTQFSQSNCKMNCFIWCQMSMSPYVSLSNRDCFSRNGLTFVQTPFAKIY